MLLVFLLMILIQPVHAGSSSVAADCHNKAFQMLAVCENSQTQLKWNYAENINDQRGITFGAIGFTTGTYDGNALIKYYTTLNPNNNLAKYIPALDAIDAGRHTYNDADSSDSIIGLDNFIKDVNSNTDPLWVTAQLHEIERMYWNPTVATWNAIGANNELTLAYLYNANVRFGNDGMHKFVDGATIACGGTPATGINENTYLTAIMAQMDAQIAREGLGDNDRSKGFKILQAEGNLNLTTPFEFTQYGDSYIITGNLDFTTPVSVVVPATPTPITFPDPVVIPTPTIPVSTVPVVPIISTIPTLATPTVQPSTQPASQSIATEQSIVDLLAQSTTPNKTPTLITFLTRNA